RRYSNTRIGDLDSNTVVFPECLDRDGPSIMYCLSGIHEDIHENLVQLVRKAFDFRQIAKLSFDADAVLQLMLQKSESALDPLVNVDRFSLGFIEASEVPETPDDLHDAIRSNLIVPANPVHYVQQPCHLLV